MKNLSWRRWRIRKKYWIWIDCTDVCADQILFPFQIGLSDCWHDPFSGDNKEYHCWPITASSTNPNPYTTCDGMCPNPAFLSSFCTIPFLDFLGDFNILPSLLLLLLLFLLYRLVSREVQSSCPGSRCCGPDVTVQQWCTDVFYIIFPAPSGVYTL